MGPGPSIVARLVLTAGLVVASACGGPTGPSDTSYAGEWSGTTAQGRPISFTISADQMVTALSVSHDFNGCSGTQTFGSLSLRIAPQVECIPGPCSPSIQSYRAFAYSSGDRVDGPSTSVNAVFMSTARAEGVVNFRSFPGCGTAIGVGWAATRR